MTHTRLPSDGAICVGCGIPLSDGYVTGCDQCSNRRQRRLKRGELFTPTCYSGEAICNTTGRIVASGGARGMKHGDMPAPNVEQLLEPDPDLYLAGGSLAPDHCECDGLCECKEEDDA